MENLDELFRKRYGLSEAKIKGDYLSDTISGLLNRRCIRRYTEEAISDNLLDTLLACSQSAPTKSNLQQYSIIVTRNHARRMQLAELNPDTGHMKYCPVILTFCADIRRGQRITNRHGLTFSNNNMDTFLNSVVDAALAMQCFVTAAESAGLGCAPISQVRNRMREFCDILEIPKGVFPIAGMTLGWPAWDGRLNPRLPMEVVVHKETYKDDRLYTLVEGYDDVRHQLAPISKENQRHTEIYGTSEHCSWSENIARQLSVPERSDFKKFLLSNGFDLS